VAAFVVIAESRPPNLVPLVSFGDDFWIENEQGQRAFKMDGKMLRVRDTLEQTLVWSGRRNLGRRKASAFVAGAVVTITWHGGEPALLELE
jgi:hypothetical protein